MLTPRIFVGDAPSAPAPGADYPLSEAAARHVGHALRMRVGDRLALFTGRGGEYAATIARIERRAVTLRVEAHDAVERETPAPVTLVQAVIAADMMDLIVRKAVELGAAAIAPVLAARSQHVPAERIARRLAHWRQIAIAACEQCGRNRVPDVHAVTTLSAWIAGTAEPVAVLDASAGRSLAEFALTAAPRAIAVGPEGGFAPEELRLAVDRGATLVHLGRRVLRAETAALAALATVDAVAGDAR